MDTINNDALVNTNIDCEFHTLFSKIIHGCVIYKVIFDETGAPCDYVYAKINPAFEALLGHKEDEVIGKSVKKITPLCHAVPAGKLTQAVHTKKPVRYCRYFRDLDQYWDILLCAVEPGHIFSAWVDITEFVKEKQMLSWKQPWLETLLKMHTMTTQNIEEIINFALQKAMNFTDSKMGNLIVANDPGQSHGVILAPHMKATGIIPPKLLDIMSEQHDPLIVNNLKDMDFLEEILPPDHVPITRLLIAPLFKGENLALLGVLANKNSDYSCFEVHQFSLFLKELCRIIENRQAKEQLETNKKYFHSIIENASDIVIVMDYDGNILYISPSVYDALGYRPEELIGKYVFNSPLSADINEIKENLAKAKTACGGIIRQMIPFKSQTGKWHYFEVKTRSLPPESYVSGVVIIARDITDLKTAEMKMRESEEKYSKLFKMAGDAIFIVDSQTGIIVEANKRAEKLTGLTIEEIVGKPYLTFLPKDDSGHAPKLFNRLSRLKRQVIAHIGEQLMVHSSGQLIPVELNVSIIDMEKKHYLLSICRDLTSRKRREDERLQKTVEEATREAQKKITNLKKLAAHSIGLRDIHCSSPDMQIIINEAHKYHQARSIPVLIQGETGTGKEVIARLIHFGDMDDPDAPFVAVNCAAINPTLFESEFFGYEPGAFTGGLKSGQKGKFDLARKGTIFLDEFAEIPIELQGKLLRVIEEKEYYRVGGLSPVKTDARIVCATNVDIASSVQAGTFRKDLYYRLSIGHIIIPPLRERKNEILPIALMYLKQYAEQNCKKFKDISLEAARILLTYSWPGNIRELKNLMEWVALMHDDEELKPFHLSKLIDIQKTIHPEPESESFIHKKRPNKKPTPETLKRALELSQGNISKAAKYLGVSRPTVYKYCSLYKL